jgi:hypothetical protein
MFVHHVFFWLKSSNTPEEVMQFETSVSTLKGIKSVHMADIGKPASTDRPVIDTTYSYSLLLMFNSLADHDAYQVDPVHLQFVANSAHLWDRVQIYDSVSI